jgi:predicted nucleic acid-binding protein
VTEIVVDVSVAAKWVLPRKNESFVDQAADLLRRYSAGEISVVVPDVFWAELGNVLWKAAQAGRCSGPDAIAGLDFVRKYHLPSIASSALIEHALEIAIVFGQTVYDALYVALAVESNAQLVTADEKLARGVAPHLPVKWIGAITT